MTERPNPLLAVRNLEAFYGESKVLHGMTFAIEAGEVVTLLGRNGTGKTTTMRSIMGILRPVHGSIALKGKEISELSSNRVARLGVGYCPEERGIFASLTVNENLGLPPRIDPRGFSDEKLYGLFPGLNDRRTSQGTKLSGGEQQMLAIARILRTGARLLLLDEPTEGLAPIIVKQIGKTIRMLSRSGFTVLLVEQNFHFASMIADRHYVVEHGKVVDMITDDQVSANIGRLENYLGI
jgi:branched-chain amino acid transport system ATP-binding protein